MLQNEQAIILVTGGAGSHTVLELLHRHYQVVIVDNLIHSDYRVIKTLEKMTGKTIYFHKVDILNKNALDAVFQQYPTLEAVLHFAGKSDLFGLKSVSESWDRPLDYYQTNVIGTRNIVECITAHPTCHKLIYSSSACVYGQVECLPCTESTPCSPTSPYGNTKLQAEQFIQEACLVKQDKPLYSIILRYFNPTGAHPSGLLGEPFDHSPQNLMPLLLQTALGLRNHVLIYGNDYKTPDGTGCRDYVHVQDIALGHIAALDRLHTFTREGWNYEIYNLGLGLSYSVLQVISTLEAVSGKKIHFQLSPRRKGDVGDMYAHVDRAKLGLQWEAKKTLWDMCQDAWRYASNSTVTKQ